jgi:hypothetical protein
VDDEEQLTPGRIAAAIVFALIAVAFFVAGAAYVGAPARDLPGFMDHANSGVHHYLRGAGSFLLCLLFAVAAWFAWRYRSLALEEAREADRAARAAAEAAASAESAAPPAGGGPLDDAQSMDTLHS